MIEFWLRFWGVVCYAEIFFGCGEGVLRRLLRVFCWTYGPFFNYYYYFVWLPFLLSERSVIWCDSEN